MATPEFRNMIDDACRQVADERRELLEQCLEYLNQDGGFDGVEFDESTVINVTIRQRLPTRAA